jgi:prophage tail gpP-like protein
MKPIPGKQYTIVDENTLSQVAARAYGDAQLWPRIWQANQTRLQSGNPDLIFPGETILIPEIPERELPAIPASQKDPNAFFIDLEGQEVRPIETRVIRAIDTVANECRIVIPYAVGEFPLLDEKVKPRTYTKTKVSIGGERVLTGRLYQRTPRVSGGKTLEMIINSSTVDLVDSDMKPPFEFNNITIEELLDKLVKPLGFNTRILVDDTGGPFERVTINQGEKYGQFFTRLTRQRGLLLTCDQFDRPVLTRANLTDAPIATLEEGITPGVTGWSNAFNDRDGFREYRAVGRNPLDGNVEATATDERVPRSRFKTVTADESTSGNIQDRANWAKNKSLADALSFPLTVVGHRDPQGDLWIENKQVTIISPTLFIPKGFNFLINRVEYVDGGNGRTTVLHFVPPTVYTQGEIIEPW